MIKNKYLVRGLAQFIKMVNSPGHRMYTQTYNQQINSPNNKNNNNSSNRKIDNQFVTGTIETNCAPLAIRYSFELFFED